MHCCILRRIWGLESIIKLPLEKCIAIYYNLSAEFSSCKAALADIKLIDNV